MTAPPTEPFTVPLRDGHELDFTGQLLGHASSWQPDHRPEKRPNTLYGTVKWFSTDKGYGFITPDHEAEDVFVHTSALQHAGYRLLSADERVSYELVPGRNGPQAGHLRLNRPVHDSVLAPAGVRCSTCRWIELDIYRVDEVLGVFDPAQDEVDDGEREKPQGEYLVFKRGRTIVPGEIELFNPSWVRRGSDVVQSMVYKGRLDGANRAVLEAAAKHDEHIAKALALW